MIQRFFFSVVFLFFLLASSVIISIQSARCVTAVGLAQERERKLHKWKMRMKNMFRNFFLLRIQKMEGFGRFFDNLLLTLPGQEAEPDLLGAWTFFPADFFMSCVVVCSYIFHF